MAKRVPANSFLNPDLRSGWSNIPSQNGLSPVWPASSVAPTGKNPVVWLPEDPLPSPLQKSFGNERMNGNGLLRCLRLARTNDTIDDGSGHVHRPLGEIDVTPFQAEQFALPQASGHCKKDQRSFSNCQTIYQSVDFWWREDSGRCAAFGALTNEMDWIAVKTTRIGRRD